MPEDNLLAPLAQALLTDADAHPLATWTYDLDTGTWTWSPELYSLLGFAPGEVVPTADLLVAHRTPRPGGPSDDDVAELCGGQPFARALQFLDARQRTRSLLVVGRTTPGPAGRPHRVKGVVIDLTGWRREASEDDIREGIDAAAEHRGVIDQAKGALMALHAMTADEAFDALVRHSQAANVKVRELAGRVMCELSERERRTTTEDGLLGRIAAGR